MKPMSSARMNTILGGRCAGGWLAVKTVLDKGPTVTITFRTAEGI